MQTTFSIFALGFISAALGAESGHSPASAHPESIDLRATPSPLVTESGFASQLHRASRPVLRRKESLTTVLAAAASAAAIVAVAFLVLQCFKAIGKASRASSSLRRLASGSAHGEGDCQQQPEEPREPGRAGRSTLTRGLLLLGLLGGAHGAPPAAPAPAAGAIAPAAGAITPAAGAIAPAAHAGAHGHGHGHHGAHGHQIDPVVLRTVDQLHQGKSLAEILGQQMEKELRPRRRRETNPMNFTSTSCNFDAKVEREKQKYFFDATVNSTVHATSQLTGGNSASIEATLGANVSIHPFTDLKTQKKLALFFPTLDNLNVTVTVPLELELESVELNTKDSVYFSREESLKLKRLSEFDYEGGVESAVKFRARAELSKEITVEGSLGAKIEFTQIGWGRYANARGHGKFTAILEQANFAIKDKDQTQATTQAAETTQAATTQAATTQAAETATQALVRKLLDYYYYKGRADTLDDYRVLFFPNPEDYDAANDALSAKLNERPPLADLLDAAYAKGRAEELHVHRAAFKDPHDYQALYEEASAELKAKLDAASREEQLHDYLNGGVFDTTAEEEEKSEGNLAQRQKRAAHETDVAKKTLEQLRGKKQEAGEKKRQRQRQPRRRAHRRPKTDVVKKVDQPEGEKLADIKQEAEERELKELRELHKEEIEKKKKLHKEEIRRHLQLLRGEHGGEHQ